METRSAILNPFFTNFSKNNKEKEINNERIKNKIELRQKDINNILFSARKLKDENSVKKNEEKKIDIKKLKEIEMPSDFQINTFKYYESVIFL